MSTLSLETDHRQQRAVAAWNLDDEIVLIGAGGPIPIPGGMDQCFPFHPHPDYRWLCGRTRENGVLAYDPLDGWTLFEPVVSTREAMFGGSEAPIGRPLDELDSWIRARAGRLIATLGVQPKVQADLELSRILAGQLLHARRAKDEVELENLRRAVSATQAGFQRAEEFIRAGVTERSIQVAIECSFMRSGADKAGYGTTVGAGPNSAIFHHAPGYRIVGEDDVVLVDAGAEVDGYVADVTRTFSASGQFTSQQRDLYEAVLAAEEAAIRHCRVGTEWLDVHRTAAVSLAQSLRDLNVLRCSAQAAVESGVIGLFFPHSVGHMTGLGVRDASGPLPGRSGESQVAGVSVRMDLPLQESYVVTVEPGIYFIRALLQNHDHVDRFRDSVNWDSLESWYALGGIRIEDDVLITSDRPEVLTQDIPK